MKDAVILLINAGIGGLIVTGSIAFYYLGVIPCKNKDLRIIYDLAFAGVLVMYFMQSLSIYYVAHLIVNTGA